MVTKSRAMQFGRYDYALFLCYITYAAGSMVVPVSLVLLARNLGFRLEAGGMAAGGALNIGRTFTMVATMLFCGFWSNRWGKRRVLGVAVLVMGIGIGLCAAAPVYGMLFAALALAGLGEGVIEGLATPFAQDLHPDEPGRYINFSHAFWSVGVVVAVVLSGGMLTHGVSWRHIVAGVGLLAIAPAALILTPRPSGCSYPEAAASVGTLLVVQRIHRIVRTPLFWLFFASMFVAGGGEFCLTFWCASYLQLHFHASAWMGGIGTATFAAGMILGRTGWGYLLKQHHFAPLIVFSAVGGALVTFALPLATHLGSFISLLFIAGIATAPFWPSIQSYSADRLEDVDPTLLFILLACAGVPGCGFATWLIGYTANALGGLQRALYIVPCYFVLLAILIGCDVSRTRTAVPCDV